MQHKNALFGLIVATLFFGGILILGLINIDPLTAQWLGFAIVTASMALFLWALIGTLLLSGRLIRKKEHDAAVSMRQASFLSIMVIVALYLQRFLLLTWWNIAILIVIIILLEIFFIGKEAETS